MLEFEAEKGLGREGINPALLVIYFGKKKFDSALLLIYFGAEGLGGTESAPTL